MCIHTFARRLRLALAVGTKGDGGGGILTGMWIGPGIRHGGSGGGRGEEGGRVVLSGREHRLSM